MFIVFAGDQYYPLGGYRDYRGQFYTIGEAREYLLSSRQDWWQIVHNGYIVEEGFCQ